MYSSIMIIRIIFQSPGSIIAIFLKIFFVSLVRGAHGNIRLLKDSTATDEIIVRDNETNEVKENESVFSLIFFRRKKKD